MEDVRDRASQMATVVDMHLHTVHGSADSELAPDDLAMIAMRVGMNGINITEHDKVWDRHVLNAYQGKHDPLFVTAAMEVTTDLGHLIAIGLSEYLPGIRRAAELRRAVDAVGGFLIVAHPFRHWFESASGGPYSRREPDGRPMIPEEAAKLPVIQLVDGIEVLNGANTMRENRFALEVATYLGKPATGGSDAHSTKGIGIYTTVFEVGLGSGAQMLEELHAGRIYPALGLPEGKLRRFNLVEAV